MSNQLEEAMEVYLAWRSAEPQPAPEEVLAQHPELADYLSPMLFPEAEHTATGEPPRAPGQDAGDDSAEPRVLGDFRLLREIGRGGMGVVHEAYQATLGRKVALKILSPQLTHDPSSLVRFRREATTAARLQHPGIAQVLEFGNVGEQHFLAMQLVRGVSLESLLRELRPHPLSEASGVAIRGLIDQQLGTGTQTPRTDTDAADSAITWSGGFIRTMVSTIIQVAETLDYAHSEGVIHRDVKPSNILLQQDGRAVLVDFGLAREMGLSSLTMTGDFAGSPYYVSPEQGSRQSSDLDRRTDIFSLGITLYECLTLQRPFEGSSPHAVIDRILHTEPTPPNKTNPAIPLDLVAITLKAIEKPIHRRYQSAAEFAQDLRAFLELRPVTARIPSRWTRAGRWIRREPLKAMLAAVVVVAVVLGAYLGLSQQAREAGENALRQDRVEECLAEGWLAHFENEGETAIRWFQQALDLDPGNPRAIFGLVRTRIHSSPNFQKDEVFALIDAHRIPGRGDAALQAMRNRFLRSPQEELKRTREQLTDPLTLFVLSQRIMPMNGAEDADGTIPACRALLEAAIFNSEKPNCEIFLALAFLAPRTGDKELCRRVAYALRTHWPRRAPTLVAMGVALLEAAPEQSIETIREALKLRPELYTAHATMAFCLQRLRRFREAAAAARKAASIKADHVMLNLCCRMITFVALREEEDPAKKQDLYREALEYGERAVAAFPASGPYLMDVGFAKERLGDQDGALDAVQKVVRLSPRLGRGHRSLIGLARILGDEDTVRAEHERWVRANPNGPTAFREFAEYLLEHGDGDADLDRAMEAIRWADRLTQGRDAYILVTLAEVLDRKGEPAQIPMILRRAENFLPTEEEEREGIVRRIAALRPR